MTENFAGNPSEMLEYVVYRAKKADENKPDGELQGAYINYRETADKRVVYQWIAEEMKKKQVSVQAAAEIERIKSRHLILNVPAAERKKDSFSCYTKLKYEELFRILQLCGSTLHDFFDGVGVSVPELWPENADENDEKYADRTAYLPREISDLYHICDALPDKMREKLLTLARKLSPLVWQSEVDDSFAIVRESDFFTGNQPEGSERRTGKPQKYAGNPTQKAYWLLRRRELTTRQLTENTAFWQASPKEKKEFEKFTKGKEWQKPVRFELMPRVAYALQISLHELLGAPDCIYLYATKPHTESIVTAYYFMSEPCKTLFRSVATACLEEWREA